VSARARLGTRDLIECETRGGFHTSFGRAKLLRLRSGQALHLSDKKSRNVEDDLSLSGSRGRGGPGNYLAPVRVLRSSPLATRLAR
jgi:hypothetical protein